MWLDFSQDGKKHTQGRHVAFVRSQQRCFPKPYVAMRRAAYNSGKLRTRQSIGILECCLFLWFPGETTGCFWKLRREWVSWRHQKCLPQFWMAFSRGAKAHPILPVACLRADPPRVVGSMSESPCHAVTISGFFSKSAKFFQTLMAPSSREGEKQYEPVPWRCVHPISKTQMQGSGCLALLC